MNCKNCKSEIKKGNDLFPQDAIDLINLYTKENKEEYCISCAKKPYLEAMKWKENRLKEIQPEINKRISKLPNLNCIAPSTWNYDVVGIVTGKIVLAQTWFSSDNNDISVGVNDCILQLYNQSVSRGGNLVMGITIHIMEINNTSGGKFDKTVITSTGTAIKLKDLNVLTTEQQSIMVEDEIGKEIRILKSAKNYNI